jgi:hypothetical protein
MHRSKPFILLLVLSVFTASLFCCCLTEEAQAKPDLPPCHQQEHQADHPEKDCECTQLQSLAVAPSFNLIKADGDQVNTIDIFASALGPVAQPSEIYLLSALTLEHASASPPPLYLKYSNLRL